jgi:hypothetical protein
MRGHHPLRLPRASIAARECSGNGAFVPRASVAAVSLDDVPNLNQDTNLYV